MDTVKEKTKSIQKKEISIKLSNEELERLKKIFKTKSDKSAIEKAIKYHLDNDILLLNS